MNPCQYVATKANNVFALPNHDIRSVDCEGVDSEIHYSFNT